MDEREPAAVRAPNGDGEDRSMPDLLRALSEQTTALVRQEIELAKADGWLAALIVAVVYAVVAAVLALLGKKKTQAGAPPVPERAITSTKEDVEWAKTRAKSARR
jgi:hypothetical protein